ncbi:MAG: polysaccharide biosynthesis/export family protein [Mesorhizobium sp.]
MQARYLTGEKNGVLRRAAPLLLALAFASLVFLAHPALSDEPSGPLKADDTVELRVTGWTALKGGVAEASVLNDDFTIAHSGSLELPFIGSVAAAGLSPEELARQITDRLQARSGLKERPITTIQLSRKSKPLAPAKQVARDASKASSPAAPPSDQAIALNRERARADALKRELDAAHLDASQARKEAEAARTAARDSAKNAEQGAAGDRMRQTELSGQLETARRELEASKVRLQQEVRTAAQVKGAANALAADAQEAAARAQDNVARLEEALQTVRRETAAALKSRKAEAEAREGGLRQELAAIRIERDAALNAVARATESGRAAKRALEEARANNEALARELAEIRAAPPVTAAVPIPTPTPKEARPARSTTKRRPPVREAQAAPRPKSRLARWTTIVLPDALLPTQPPAP